MAATLKPGNMSPHSPVIAPIDEALGATPLERSNILIVDDRLDKRVVFRTILEELDQNIVPPPSGGRRCGGCWQRVCAVILLT